MADTRAILAAVKSTLQGIDGTGSYHYDVSGTDGVIIGEVSEGYVLPQILVFVDRLDVGAGYELTAEKMTLTLHATGFVAAGDTGEDRLLNAADMMTDIMSALRGNRTLGSLAIDTKRTGSVMLYEAETGDLFGVADVIVTVEWQEDAT